MLKNSFLMLTTLLLFFNPISGQDVQNDSLTGVTQTTEQSASSTTPTCSSDEDFDKAILGSFSKILVHFASILQDPKNAAHRNPNLMGIVQAACSIIMHMFKTKTRISPEVQEWYDAVIELQNVLLQNDKEILL